MERKLNVNGTMRQFEADADTPLLWVLRDHLGLPGTKFGCGVMACGACTVLVDGKATRSCQMPVSALDESRTITTIESTALRSQQLIKKAWTEHSVSQCGYCQPGMIMTATALLEEKPNPSDSDIEQHMTNICRCGTYQLVRVAIKQAAKELHNG